MASRGIKLVLCLVLLTVFTVQVNGMWAIFMQDIDLNDDGVLEGDQEMAGLKQSLMQVGESDESAQQAIDSADSNYDGSIDADEYGEMRANLLL